MATVDFATIGVSEAGDRAGFSVLLIGNYPLDRQHSMQRFSDAMRSGLQEAGIHAEVIRPEVTFGRWSRHVPPVFGKWLGYLDKFLVFPRRLRRAVERSRSRVIVHVCDHSNAFYVPLLRDVPHVVTCHDLLAVRSALGEIPENPTGWTGRQLQGLILRGLKRARRVVCDSRATESDTRRLTDLAPEKISVLPIAANSTFAPLASGPARALAEAVCLRGAGRSPGARFFLHVGGNVWYKNRIGALRILAHLAALADDPPSLVSVGEPFNEEMSALIAERGLAGRILRVPSCSDEELRALYASAEALVFPSLAEGFGWPVIEAQACGCPVVCSDAGPLPDVAGGAAQMRPASDEAGLAAAILRLSDPVERKQWIERGLANAALFTSQKMIEGYLAVYQELVPARL